MKKLRILTLGTENYLRTYSPSLQKDCEQQGYEFEKIVIEDQKDISNINHRILQAMVEYISNNDFERLCFMDPECRIVRPIPAEWIENDAPVVFFKVRNQDGTPDPKFVYKNKHGNGERLPCRIIGQPMFISGHDVQWFTMTLDLSKAASDRENQQFTRNEMFIETALEYHNIKYDRQHIIYNRHTSVPHLVVKGTWQTADTVIKHPDIYGLFDTDIMAGNPVFGENNILDAHLLERHTADIGTLDKLNHHMWLEASDQWEDFDEWTVHAKSGRIKLKGFNGVKYHHSIRIKQERAIMTPLIKAFKNNMET